MPIEVLLGALLLAWVLDRWLPEPPNRWHPVAWMGALLGPAGRFLCRRAAPWALLGGFAVWMLLAVCPVTGLALATLAIEWLLPPWAQALLMGLLLKPALAGRQLHDEVAAVEQALAQNLAAGQARVARLCSRDVSHLDATQVRETAIETLAENHGDSLLAPLFWFAVAGVPGAWLYRLANTADAMWGYRGRWEWAGKWAAWADDLLNAIPSRLSALCLAPLQALRPLRLWRTARRTPSPNGGWPMGALALQLGVRLSKPGVYVLNEAGRAPEAADLAEALRRFRLASVAAWLGAAGLLIALHLERVA